VGGALFIPGEEDLEVVVETDRAGAWIVDYYPVDRVEDLGDGHRRVTLHVSDPGLVRRLAWRMGGHVRVVSPVDLAASVTSGAQEALSAYTAVPSGAET
jgi:proteasome accessory factor C